MLTSQYDQLVAGGPGTQSEAAAVLTSRSQLTSEIGEIQQQIQEASLKTHAIVNASNVIDPASVMPQSGLKRAVLVVGSGLIAGLALGVALVLFPAITSDKLRRRDEVAEAVGAPVRVSVGSVAGGWRPWPVRGKARERDLAVVTHALESAVPTDETPGRADRRVRRQRRPRPARWSRHSARGWGCSGPGRCSPTSVRRAGWALP